MKIALLGYGIEGQSSHRYLAKLYPEAIFDVYVNRPLPGKQLPHGVTLHEVDDFSEIDADLVVRTPSIAPVEISSRGTVTSATQLFFDACPAPIVGVTGSKGKGTTSSLIAEILRAAGRKAHLLGNIGEPALDALGDIGDDDVVVYELSSFQLWDIKKSPHVAVVLMIEPDHLEVHADMNEYVQAKSNIVQFQAADDTVVFYVENSYSKQIAEQSQAKKIPYPHAQYAHAKDGYFYYGDRVLCPTAALSLPGQHNIDNAAAAISAAWEWVQDGEAIAEGLNRFKGLPHRLKLVRELDNIRYYDDSIATTPGSAIAALRAFKEPKVLILGGSSKGADFAGLAHEVAESTIRKVLLIGQESDRIASALAEANVTNFSKLEDVTMNDIVAEARKEAEPGDVVVMSPSCASFDMFKSYKDRGEQFISAVNGLVEG